jgi:hypothetical protein
MKVSNFKLPLKKVRIGKTGGFRFAACALETKKLVPLNSSAKKISSKQISETPVVEPQQQEALKSSPNEQVEKNPLCISDVSFTECTETAQKSIFNSNKGKNPKVEAQALGKQIAELHKVNASIKPSVPEFKTPVTQKLNKVKPQT